MDALIELLVNSTGGTAQGVVDLHGDEPITMQMAIADIKDIKVGKSTFSQSFVVPGTKNNNELFNYLFQIGADSQFDPRKKTPCQLLVDTIPILQSGTLQLTGINVDDKKNISYEVSVFDDKASLYDTIGDAELTDLSFSGLNHVWTYSSITATWTGTSQPYFYPLIDYGYDLAISTLNTGNGLDVTQMYPAIQAKYILDKIFEKAGFRYESSLFDSDYFKNLYLPFNGSNQLNNDPSFATGRTFFAHYTATTVYPTYTISASSFPTSVVSSEIPVIFTDDFTPPNFDNGNLYNNLTGVYTANTYYIQTLNVSLDYEFATSGITNFNIPPAWNVRFYRSGYLGGTTYFYEGASLSTATLLNVRQVATISTPPLDGAIGTALQPCQPNETFWATYEYFYTLNPPFTTGGTITATVYPTNSIFYNNVSTQAIQNQLIDYNTFIPKKIKQIDFLNSLITMHNLYVAPSKSQNNTLVIEPRDTYYSGGTTLDWSGKVDLSQPVIQQLISEQTNKRIIFTYKADKDYYNDDYHTKTNKIFGDSYTIIDNDFVKDDKIIDVIFSPTPSVAVLESNTTVPFGVSAATANEFVIPKIGKIENGNNFGRTDFNIRILQKYKDNLVSLNTGDTWRLSGNTFNNYPYLGMLNHPFTGTTDIGWDAVDYVYYTLPTITSNNLVNAYWRTYLDQITDKDAKIISCYIYLTPADINQFDFRNTVFIDELTPDGGGYYLVDNIEYVATANVPSKVDLIKVNNKLVTITTNSIPNVNGATTLQSIAFAGATVLSSGSIGLGNNVTIGTASAGSFALGTDLVIGGGSPRSMVIGSGSTISSGAQGSFVFGDGITAVSGNTLYTNNIILSSGGTINNFTLSGLTVFLSGSGIGSVYMNNGTGNVSSGGYSYAEGSNTTANGSYSHAEGQGTIASGFTSHAEGQGTHAGTNSHSEGYFSTAIGLVSHAEGEQTSANGEASHSEGYFTTAISNYSHSEGYLTTASGQTSHAEGNTTIAHRENSHVGGQLTNAYSPGEWARNGTDINYRVQYGTINLYANTVNAVATEAFINLSSDVFVIPINSSRYCRVYCVAAKTTAGDSVTFKGEGLIKNVGGTTSLVGAFTMTQINSDAALTTTSVAVTANNANSSLQVKVTGVAATLLVWNVRIDYDQTGI